MKKNKYKEIQTNSRNKKYELKSKLTSLADNAKTGINKNKILREIILNLKNQIAEHKKKFLKYSTLKLTSKTDEDFSNSIKTEINSNNSSMIEQNNSLKRLIKALKIKYDSIIEKGREIVDNIINDIDSIKEKNFLINNAIQSKENETNYLSKTISKIKAESHKQTIDRIEYNENELEDEIDFKSELKNSLEYHTLLYDQNLAQINKYINDCKKRAKKILNLKTKKKNIKKYIKTLNNLITNFDCLSFPDNRNIIIEGEECLQETNEIEEALPIDNNDFSISEESESFLNDTIIANLDIKEFEIIRNVFLEEKSKLISLSQIPKLDLALINFNKQKLNYDYDEKSLSRNDMKEHDLLSLRIIKLREEVKALSDKNDKLNEKIKKYSEKIYKLNKILINMNYQNPNSFRIKSIKKRKFVFNSTTAFSNVSRNANSLSYRVDDLKFKNKFNLNDMA